MTLKSNLPSYDELERNFWTRESKSEPATSEYFDRITREFQKSTESEMLKLSEAERNKYFLDKLCEVSGLSKSVLYYQRTS